MKEVWLHNHLGQQACVLAIVFSLNPVTKASHFVDNVSLEHCIGGNPVCPLNIPGCLGQNAGF